MARAHVLLSMRLAILPMHGCRKPETHSVLDMQGNSRLQAVGAQTAFPDTEGIT